MNQVLLIYLLLINAVGFLIMLVDKQKARKKLWRIPEATLMTVALIGGSLGSLIGMRVFHHKTKKPKFWLFTENCRKDKGEHPGPKRSEVLVFAINS